MNNGTYVTVKPDTGSDYSTILETTTSSDGSFQTGQAGLGIQGYRTDQFDNLSITPGTGNPPTGGTGRISSVLNGDKCLDDLTGSTTAGAVVDIWDCDNGSNQKWNLPS
ncbi:RICIN domain-containing protein [Streptomyces sp. NBC_00342]|uniref:RICIN domain-containing protein n=1 Tax=Streptomyces sp. NBC_00342 TaxID=2975718 RepID=UPI002E2C78B9|nr:RICIN domain-containing protein [Streptomyces sp. NBC_00342]